MVLSQVKRKMSLEICDECAISNATHSHGKCPRNLKGSYLCHDPCGLFVVTPSPDDEVVRTTPVDDNLVKEEYQPKAQSEPIIDFRANIDTAKTTFVEGIKKAVKDYKEDKRFRSGGIVEVDPSSEVVLNAEDQARICPAYHGLSKSTLVKDETGTMEKERKIVQITNIGSAYVALTDDGKLWKEKTFYGKQIWLEMDDFPFVTRKEYNAKN